MNYFEKWYTPSKLHHYYILSNFNKTKSEIVYFDFFTDFTYLDEGKKTPKATKAKGKGKAVKETKVEDETPSLLEEQEEYVEKEYNRVNGQNVVVLSFLTPSLTNTAILKDKIEKTTDLQTKCNLYEELMNEKLSTRAVKILGVFKDEEEARIYVTTELPDYKDFHIFLGDMHKWLAFNEDFCDSKRIFG